MPSPPPPPPPPLTFLRATRATRTLSLRQAYLSSYILAYNPDEQPAAHQQRKNLRRRANIPRTGHVIELDRLLNRYDEERHHHGMQNGPHDVQPCSPVVEVPLIRQPLLHSFLAYPLLLLTKFIAATATAPTTNAVYSTTMNTLNPPSPSLTRRPNTHTHLSHPISPPILPLLSPGPFQKPNSNVPKPTIYTNLHAVSTFLPCVDHCIHALPRLRSNSSLQHVPIRQRTLAIWKQQVQETRRVQM
ncbi:hypothetical protein GE09DRAFT_521439 [Coniochaeta sp. 2T2.1]|nr:hypothetical protein GE09DRAFT_521439 [Coniochaeta sp. 2T2.1]